MGIVYTSLLASMIFLGTNSLDGLSGLLESNYTKYCLLFISWEISSKHSTPVLKHQINEEKKRRQNST